MTKITKEWLNKWDACSDGVDWFNNQKETDGKKVIEKLIKEEKLNWANWTICKLLSKENRIRYAIFAAEQVLPNFEKEFPDDKRPREALQAAVNYLKNPNEKTASAARSAARSAESAARAAKIKILNYDIELLEGKHD